MRVGKAERGRGGPRGLGFPSPASWESQSVKPDPSPACNAGLGQEWV